MSLRGGTECIYCGKELSSPLGRRESVRRLYPLISIITPCYNAAPLLPKRLNQS